MTVLYKTLGFTWQRQFCSRFVNCLVLWLWKDIQSVKSPTLSVLSSWRNWLVIPKLLIVVVIVAAAAVGDCLLVALFWVAQWWTTSTKMSWCWPTCLLTTMQTISSTTLMSTNSSTAAATTLLLELIGNVSPACLHVAVCCLYQRTQLTSQAQHLYALYVVVDRWSGIRHRLKLQFAMRIVFHCAKES